MCLGGINDVVSGALNKAVLTAEESVCPIVTGRREDRGKVVDVRLCWKGMRDARR